MDYRSELAKLASMLVELGVEFKFIKQPHFAEGWQIVADGWDAVCNELSYGGRCGELEVMGSIVPCDADDDVVGWLHADDIIAMGHKAGLF